jgi:hypothetical protein
MQIIQSKAFNEYEALQRLDAILSGGEWPVVLEDMPVAPPHFDIAADVDSEDKADEAAHTATVASAPELDLPSHYQKPRRRRVVGTLTFVAVLGVVGGTLLSGGKLDNFAAKAGTLTAAISQHLTSGR